MQKVRREYSSYGEGVMARLSFKTPPSAKRGADRDAQSGLKKEREACRA